MPMVTLEKLMTVAKEGAAKLMSEVETRLRM